MTELSPQKEAPLRRAELVRSDLTVEDRMREVIGSWDAAPWNVRKSASFRLYNAAGRAYAAGNLTACLRLLDAAEDALG